MAVSLTDTDIHESHCRRLLQMYKRPPNQSRNRPSFFSPGPHLLDVCTRQIRCTRLYERAQQGLASHFLLLLLMKTAAL